MREPWRQGSLDRRAFLKTAAAMGGAMAAAGCAGGAAAEGGVFPASAAPALRDRMGIQLYTVRDLIPGDYEGTLVKIAQIGFKEVEPTGYGTYTPQQFRAMLDRVGLTSPSTHANLVQGPELERQLEGYQVIGHRYSRASTRPYRPEGLGVSAAAGPPPTVDDWKRNSAVYNEIGEVAAKYGVKVMIHNHTAEFAPLAGSSLRPFDVLLAETDPALVVFQLDIGWSSVAGQDAVEIFRDNPGRFPLWHIKDVAGLRTMTPQQTMADRQGAARMAVVGEGEIEWGSIFAQAPLAGLRHYYLEIEGEAVANGSLAAAQASHDNLRRILAGV